jgi:Fe-S cluster biogenesis protein NfuA
MNLNKLLLFVCFIPMLISCKGNLNKMVSTDANMEKYIQNSEYTAIVYVDSTGGCTPCSFQHLITWKVYQKALNKHKTEILLVINHSNEQFVIEILKSIGVFHFVLDKNNKFKIMNHQIFK